MNSCTKDVKQKLIPWWQLNLIFSILLSAFAGSTQWNTFSCMSIENGDENKLRTFNKFLIGEKHFTMMNILRIYIEYTCIEYTK